MSATILRFPGVREPSDDALQRLARKMEAAGYTHPPIPAGQPSRELRSAELHRIARTIAAAVMDPATKPASADSAFMELVEAIRARRGVAASAQFLAKAERLHELLSEAQPVHNDSTK